MKPEQEGYCPYFHEAVERVGKKWTGAILFALSKDKSKFCEIKEAIPNLSDRLLCERLTELREAEILIRTGPKQKDYLLTPKGHALAEALQELTTWAHEWN